MAAAEALAAVVVEPGARSTDPILRHALLAEAGALGRPLFALFLHPAGAPPRPSVTDLVGCVPHDSYRRRRKCHAVGQHTRLTMQDVM